MGLLANSIPTTKSAVETAAEDLINKNGKTTSLEVKEHLRSNGYFATQSNVSTFLQTIQKEKGWVANTVNANGASFQEYTKPAAKLVTVQNSAKIRIVADFLDNIPDFVPGVDDLADLEAHMLDELFTLIETSFGIQKNELEEKLNNDEITTTDELIDFLWASLANRPVQPSSLQPLVPSSQQRSGRAKIFILPKALVKDANEAKSACSANDWFVSLKGSVKPYVFDSTHSSDHVRTVYARSEKVKIQDVRARRIKNLR